VEFGEPGLDLLPEEAISTSTRTLLASLWVANPGDGGPLPSFFCGILILYYYSDPILFYCLLMCVRGAAK